ncbi:thymic stromal cotransporter homolog [Denticeps clupeoides]|uniref:Thymic stromal cotransporter n=1 Tax=Denticeps clupeoides TaxID=299321 RepID=A0AAY4ADW0_9TELE|nr:thymic stromal cotransporter homolog [Denticeps clupeoides]
MAVWRLLGRHVEPVVACAQVGSAFYDTGLQMMMKERFAFPEQERQQKAMSDFYMTYNMLGKFVPIVPAIVLSKLGDRGYRKVPIVAPLVGYLVSRLLLLLVILLEWPIQAMYAATVVHGACGGFSSYWAGVMALVSVSTSEEERSVRIMRMELVYGLAGLVGSLSSGHLFQLYTVELKGGVLLVGLSVLLYFLCLAYAALVLDVSRPAGGHDRRGSAGILDRRPRDTANIALLFCGAILYDVAVGGGVEILVSFVMKEPLNWSATLIGYGNAAGFVIFITSFLGVKVFSRRLSDASMIMVGMMSFCAGIYFMAFVTSTYMYYLARSLTLFALIPMPTIRSLLSKQIKGSSYGLVLISLQLSLMMASLVYTPVYTKVYQATLDTFPGFVFTMSSIICFLAIIPICIVGCRTAHEGYERIQGN